jgi:hypothetical protein
MDTGDHSEVNGALGVGQSRPFCRQDTGFGVGLRGPANPVVVTTKGGGALGYDNHGVRHELPTGRGLSGGAPYRFIPNTQPLCSGYPVIS